MPHPNGAPAALHALTHGQKASLYGRAPVGYTPKGPVNLTDALASAGLVRPREDWSQVAVRGRLVVTPDGRPIRTIITGRRRQVTGSYPSRKAGRALPHESMNELAFFHLCEVDTDVLDYRAQPFRFEFVEDGQIYRYIADCARLLASGQVEVVEVKSDRRALRDPDYAKKLRAVAELCEELGWLFRTVLREELVHPKAWRENVLLVQSNKSVRFESSHTYQVLAAIDRCGEDATLGDVTAALGDRRAGEAIAMAMMVARIIQIDLSAPLSSASAVRAVSAIASVLEVVR